VGYGGTVAAWIVLLILVSFAFQCGHLVKLNTMNYAACFFVQLFLLILESCKWLSHCFY